MSTTIKTNNHIRPLISYRELPAWAGDDFGYMVDSDEEDSPRFVEYRGSWYDTQEFMALRSPSIGQELGLAAFDGWAAAQAESYFSAVLIRYPLKWDGLTTDWESVVVGYAHW